MNKLTRNDPVNRKWRNVTAISILLLSFWTNKKHLAYISDRKKTLIKYEKWLKCEKYLMQQPTSFRNTPVSLKNLYIFNS